jgi:hypothetical protein
MALSDAEILAIYTTLDEDRKQQLRDLLLLLIEEQRQGPRSEQRV